MLSSRYRFHRRNQVNRVYKQGSSARSGALSMKYRIDVNGKHQRFAVVVSKKVSKSAVVRNRIRRRVFEQVRLQFDSVPDGFEGVIGVFDSSVADISADELKKHIRDLLKQATKT